MTPPDPAPAATWTILQVLKWTTARFTERGLPSPRLDAELLAAHAFELPRVALYTQFDRPLLPAELTRFRELVQRRQRGEPVAYLTGRKQFWSLDLQVDARVLVPRPDTETAVEAALDLLRPPRADHHPDDQPAATGQPETAAPTAAAGDTPPEPPPQSSPPPPPLRIADIGTGSGAIALVLKKELPHAEVVAVDTSADALAVARANAERLGLAVTFLQGDLLAPLAELPPFDLIVANLPYVPSGEIPGLAPEVRCEPLLALDGGGDGLLLLRRLVADAPARLQPGGALVLEVGAGQADAVAGLTRDAGLVDPQQRRDLTGIARVVVARRAGEPS